LFYRLIIFDKKDDWIFIEYFIDLCLYLLIRAYTQYTQKQDVTDKTRKTNKYFIDLDEKMSKRIIYSSWMLFWIFSQAQLLLHIRAPFSFVKKQPLPVSRVNVMFSDIHSPLIRWHLAESTQFSVEKSIDWQESWKSEPAQRWHSTKTNIQKQYKENLENTWLNKKRAFLCGR
jgi:hypothetical protein